MSTTDKQTNMTAEEAIKTLKGEAWICCSEKWNEALGKAIEALKTKPCEDCISRQAVLEGVDTYINKAQSTGTKDDFYSFAELVVKALPPVTPQPLNTK